MWKWIVGALVAIVIVAVGFWFSIDKSIRYLILNQPTTENVLFWTTEQRDAGFRSLEALEVLPYSMVSKNSASASQTSIEAGDLLNIPEESIDAYFREQRIAGLVVLHKGKRVFEKYGLDFDKDGKWTSFSVAKSFTSTLVGAAIKDGYIKSLQDSVSDYIPDMQGSAYDDVTIEQLLTMTSGVKWDENYSDPNSDVNKFNFSKGDAGVDSTVSYMRKLERAVKPGEKWLYSTGETNLIGVLVSQSTGKTLSAYLSEKIWQHIGAEQDASWILGPSGHEISGCCIQATTRDFASFGQFILDGAVVNGESIVPQGWFEKATVTQVSFSSDSNSNGYAYQWWTSADSSFQGKGIFGQGIFIDPKRELVIAVNSNWPAASSQKEGASRSKMYAEFQKLVGI
ncbi:serine hydrolase [Glaciecola sp. MH2013]|uniref:serine hydrolase domain-containing protein n=1 Tax=Glaciecola sp. MH2013 TaxID=2785524 RepID=UPI0018A0CAFA|nr:serine hydrolase [Glaciecola sp. MH2013]MBF7073344.1 serine hydrolase [Glaciecola sp. MH2013]